MHAQLVRRAAALTLLAFLTSVTAGCSGGATGDEPTPDDDSAAITVAQAKPAEAALLVSNVPALDEKATGASKWHLFTVAASDLGKKHASFSGLIAYGTDRDDQVIWTILVDQKRPDAKGFQRIDRDGRAMLATITPELAKAFDAELSNVRDVLQKTTQALTPPAAKADSTPRELLSPGAAASLLGASVLTIGGALGYVSLGLAGVLLGVSLAILPAAVLVLTFVVMIDG